MEPARWSERIEAIRGAHFVGRSTELERFERFLDDPTLRLFHVWGQGGIGKTALLQECARRARGRGLEARFIDARALPLAPSLLAAELLAPCDALFIDEFQAIASFEPWLREEIFPSLPASSRVVTARREPLGVDWRADLGFRALVESCRLEVLSTTESERVLDGLGVEEASWPKIVALAKGLPLALVLFSESSFGEGLPAEGAASATPEALSEPALLGQLLGRLMRDVASPAHRAALEVAALSRVVTAPLLADVLGPEVDAGALFEWLRSRDFTRITDEGVVVHDVVRELVFRDLAWRDEARRRELVDRALRHQLSFFGPSHPASFIGALRSAIDLTEKECAFALDVLGEDQLRADALTEADRAPVLAAVEALMGEEQRRHAERHLVAERAGAIVGRALDGSVRAFLQMIELPRDDLSDPVVQAVSEWIGENAPLAPGERALLCRFYLPVDAPLERDSFLVSELTLRLVCTPGVAVVASFQPLLMHEHHPEFEFHRKMATFESGGLRFTLIGHDLRDGRFGEDAKVIAPGRLAFVRQLLDGAAAAQVSALGASEFEREVRRALKNFHRADLLAESPLLTARFLGGAGDVEALRRALEEGCRALGDRGDDAVLAEVLLATYVEDAKKQLAVASELGMGYSTLRKYLARATRRLVDSLWALETSAGRRA